MHWLLLTLLFSQAPSGPPEQNTRELEIRKLISDISDSGQVLEIALKAEERAEPSPKIAPGDPPLLAFRYFEGQAKHRFGNLDLVMDDAGH